MTVQIRHCVIHGFNKEQREDATDIVKKTDLLDVALPAVQTLVAGIAELLGKRANSQAWGRFGSDSRQGTFPLGFANYVAILDDPEKFLGLSHLAVDQLVSEANKEQLSTGGRILFSVFDDDAAGPIFLVAMIKQKGGVLLNDDFVPIGIIEVDMGKLHQASQIRIQHFIADQAVEFEDDEADRNYLSFLSPRASSQTSRYFIAALGCIVGITSAKATDQLFVAVEALFDTNNDLKEYRKQAKARIVEYLQKQLDSNQTASLDDICVVLKHVVRAEHASHLDDVLPYFNGPKYKIPDEFIVHGRNLKKQSRVTLKSERLAVEFEPSDLGVTQDAKLCYNKNQKTLTISNLSDEFIAKLDQAILTG
ncbi:MAG: nucleoid-associated protein [Glaciimonas sp.]|nr:nucleoid-associated protein [Glaciimonas sp.]